MKRIVGSNRVDRKAWQKWRHVVLYGVCVFIGVIVNVSTIFAQLTHAAFFQPMLKSTAMVGQSTIFGGARFGWVMGNDIHKFVVGASYHAMLNTVPSNLPPTLTPRGLLSPDLHSNYGGLEIEYIHRVMPLWDFSVGVMLAGAGTTLAIKEDIPNKPVYFSQNWNYWEPHIGVQYALTTWCKADIQCSYRFVSGTGNHYTITADNLQAWAVSIGVRFGRY